MKEKLFKIQQELNVPKRQYNSFGGYKFRSCEDILTAVKPLLKELKCILILDDQLVYIGERYYIKAVAKLIDIESEEQIANVAYAREEETKKGMDGSQITGASSSYARKYALNGLFGIDDVKDSDTTNTGVEITSKEEARALELTFGKHKGETIGELVDNNDSYINYLFENGTPDIKQAITLLTGIVEMTNEESIEKVKAMPIQETQKSRIKDEIDKETIKLYLQSLGKSKLSDLTYEEADKLLEG